MGHKSKAHDKTRTSHRHAKHPPAATHDRHHSQGVPHSRFRLSPPSLPMTRKQLSKCRSSCGPLMASPPEGRKQAFIATDAEEDHRQIDKEINQLPITNNPAKPSEKEPIRLPLHILSQEQGPCPDPESAPAGRHTKQE